MQLELLPLTNKEQILEKLTLRENQLAVKRGIYSAIKNGSSRVLVCAPCSFGKTLLVSDIVHDASVVKNKKTLFVVPFTCLIDQTVETFKRQGIEAGVIAGEYTQDRSKNVQIATVQTLSIRESWFNYDVLILDECHILAFATWVKKNHPLLLKGVPVRGLTPIQDSLRSLGYHGGNPTYDDVKKRWQSIKHDATVDQKQAYEIIKKYHHAFNANYPDKSTIVIGLTATPWRLKKTEFMSDLFDSQVLASTPGEMVEKGFLSPCIYYGIKGADTFGLHAGKDGDYRTDELEVVCTDPEVVKSAVDNYVKICPDRLFICFAVTIAHAHALTEAFNERGIKTAIITGDMSGKERKPIYEALGRGEIQGAVSCNCISIGFNVPEISCVILSRPTKSKALAIQQIGRGQRLSPRTGKTDCIVLDQAGIIKRFGFIEDIAYPDLNDNKIEVKPTPTKDCPGCGAILSQFATVCHVCGQPCGTPDGIGKDKIKPVGDLALMIPPGQQKMYEDYRKMLKSAYQLNYSPDWALMKCKERYNSFPPRDWARFAVFGESATDTHKKNYWEHLKAIAVKKAEKQLQWQKDGGRKVDYGDGWVHRHFKAEFGEKYEAEASD